MRAEKLASYLFNYKTRFDILSAPFRNRLL